MGKKMPPIKEFKPFLPSGPNGYEESINFYRDLGFDVDSTNSEVTIFDTTYGSKFILSSNENKQLGENLMLHFWVESVDDWYEYLRERNFTSRYEGTKLAKPEVMPWGLRVAYVWDPAGVLLHFAEPHIESDN